MRGFGVTYDTGFVHQGVSTHEPFDPEVVRREMQVIHDDLHATAVRVTGGVVDRLEIAAGYAADAGLDVWFCPFTCDLGEDELLAVLTDAAERAERVRRRGASVVFLAGSELSLMTHGLLPGETLVERARGLVERRPETLRALAGVPARVNDLLRRALVPVRDRFHGPVGYASLPFEQVDWTPFDLAATDAGYRDASTADRFPELVRTFVASAAGKPAAVTEFGCMTFRGAAEQGASADLDLVEWDGAVPVRVAAPHERDEAEQVAYFEEVLDVLEAEGVDHAFWYTFASRHLPHRDGGPGGDPRADLDLTSRGVVAVLPDGRHGTAYPDLPWEPKQLFTAMARRYARARAGTP